MQPIGEGTKVFDAASVRGRFRAIESPDDVLALMDTGAEGVVALVRDAGATFLAPIYHELTTVICTGGTPRSHIGIVSREFQVPCVMACTFWSGEPANDSEVEVDCSGEAGVVRGCERDHKAEANRLIAYHSPISQALSAERTSLESKLIPVTAYVITACVECWYRYPEMIRAIDAAMPADQIGRIGRRPGTRINTVHLWGVPNFWLLGRKVVAGMGIDANDPDRAFGVLDFWQRAALAFRGDGNLQAWDTDDVRPYDGAVAAQLLEATVAIDEEQRSLVKKLNATLVGYLFLMWFDTRSGAQDTGPYAVPGADGQIMLVRDFAQLAGSDFWWSDVARDVPYSNLTAVLVLDGVKLRVTDFGTSYTTPEDYLDRLVRFGLFTTDADGTLRAVPLDEVEVIVAAVRKAQSAHYRNIAAMHRDEKIRCGAYVYFSFLRPFALAAGIADELDWTVPRDIPQPLYEFVSMLEGDNTASSIDDGSAYYDLIP